MPQNRQPTDCVEPSIVWPSIRLTFYSNAVLMQLNSLLKKLLLVLALVTLLNLQFDLTISHR